MYGQYYMNLFSYVWYMLINTLPIHFGENDANLGYGLAEDKPCILPPLCYWAEHF